MGNFASVETRSEKCDVELLMVTGFEAVRATTTRLVFEFCLGENVRITPDSVTRLQEVGKRP